MDTTPPTPDRDPTDPNTNSGRARSYPPRPDPTPFDSSPFDSAPLRGPQAETSYTTPDPFAGSSLPPAEEPLFASTPPPLTPEPTFTPQTTLPPVAPPPPPANNRTRNCLLIALGALLLSLCGVCAVAALALPQLQELFSGLGGGTTSVFDLAIGDCFQDNEDGGDDLIEELQVVPCDEAHDNEVFGIVDYPAGSGEPFPAEDDLDTYTDEQCEVAFESYVGLPYAESELYYFPIQPTAETWADGDREIVCALYGVDDDGELIDLEGSMQGSNR